MTTFLGLLVLAIFLACLAGWTLLALKWRDGIVEPIPFEPRRIVPWDGPSTLLIVALYLGGQLAAQIAATRQFQVATRRALTVEAGNDPEFLVHAFSAHVVFNGLLLLIGLGWLAIRNRATLADVGFSMRHVFYDVALGIGAFLLIVPPVLLLQALMSWIFSPSSHPMLQSLRQSHSPELVFWSVMAAVVAAPVVEEFFFRVVLQGWFERLSASQSSSPVVVDAPVAAADVASPPAAAEASVSETTATEVVEPSSPRPGFAPIVLSSVLFALAHVGNGPDPIALFFLALGLGYLYRQTHRIWPGIVLHFLLNGFSTMVVMFGPSPPPPV